MSEIKAEQIWREDWQCWTTPTIHAVVLPDEDPLSVLAEIVEKHLNYLRERI